MKSEPVEYRRGDRIFRGILVDDPARTGSRPGVLVVHEAWGISEHVKQRACRLAEMGYVAFVADMFGEGRQAASTQEGLGWTKALRGDLNEMRARIRLAFDVLASRAEVDASRIAGIGYCFGGSSVLELARSGAPVAGVVSFHGGLNTPTPEDAARIKGKVLALHGADDPYVPPAEVAAFEAEMRKANVDWQLVGYGGAVHSFTMKEAGNDNSKGAAYNEKADQRSWDAMNVFFAEIFK